MNVNEFSAETPSRLDSFLSEKTGKSRAFVQEQIKLGRVQVNRIVCTKSSHRLKTNDAVSFNWIEESSQLHLTPSPGDLNIIYEDADLLALNKSAGVIVHPGAGQKENTLVHHLLHYLNSVEFKQLSPDRPGIVHRLDQGTTGVLLIAKNSEMHTQLSDLFKNRNIKKTYHAIAFGKMALAGTIDSPIGRDRKDRKKISSRSQKTRSAVTQWNTIQRFSHFSYVALHPLTGRTHQLRVHLSEAGFPIVGDPTYGRGKAKASLIPPELIRKIDQLDHTLLHAYSLEFTHPKTGKALLISAPLPEDFESFLTSLKEHDSCPKTDM